MMKKRGSQIIEQETKEENGEGRVRNGNERVQRRRRMDGLV